MFVGQVSLRDPRRCLVLGGSSWGYVMGSEWIITWGGSGGSCVGGVCCCLTRGGVSWSLVWRPIITISFDISQWDNLTLCLLASYCRLLAWSQRVAPSWYETTYLKCSLVCLGSQTRMWSSIPEPALLIADPSKCISINRQNPQIYCLSTFCPVFTVSPLSVQNLLYVHSL